MDDLNRLSVQEFRAKSKLPVILVLENIRSGLNVGSIFRSADAFRIERIICAGYTPCPPHREVLKTALGATESVSWEHAPEPKQCIQSLKDAGVAVWAVEQTHESVALHEFSLDPSRPIALVLGNEVSGVSEEVLAQCKGALEIVQLGTKHSLNVAVSAGIVLHQLALKQGVLAAEK